VSRSITSWRFEAAILLVGGHVAHPMAVCATRPPTSAPKPTTPAVCILHRIPDTASGSHGLPTVRSCTGCIYKVMPFTFPAAVAIGGMISVAVDLRSSRGFRLI